MIGQKQRRNAQRPPARPEMLEGLGDVALLTDPVLDLSVHEPTLSRGLMNL
jgi:hypothetical protein